MGRTGGAKLTPWLFLLPALAIYGAFLIYPMGRSFYISLTDWDGLSREWSFVGLANYEAIFLRDHDSRQALRNNVLWTIFTLLVPTVLGLLLATALNGAVRGRTLLRSIFYLPAVLPLVAVGMIWAWIYNPSFGAINEVLRLAGLGWLARGWLGDFQTALPATMVTALWQGVGFPMVLYLAGMQTIPREQYDAAKIDGAGPFECFKSITLPWLRETHVVVVTLAVIGSFNVFDLIYTMTYGGPGQQTQVLATWMYFNTFQYGKAGYGSALAWVIAAIALVVTIPYIRIMSRR
jgi:raffinose/stachyose/melibiose transport system permease protein